MKNIFANIKVVSSYLIMITLSLCNRNQQSSEQQDYYNQRIESLKVYETEILNNNLYGLTIVDNAKIFTEADSNSQVVAILPFATPFQVFEKETHRFIYEHFTWYRIKTLGSSIEGWISFREGRYGITKEDSLAETDLPDLFYSVGCESSWGFNDYSAAERLFKEIINRFPERQVSILDEESWTKYQKRAKNATLQRLAELYKRHKDYQKAIANYYQFLEQENVSLNDSLKTLREIMLVYANDLKDTVQTVEICQSYIKEYPNAKLAEEEWNTWLDLEAAYIIGLMLTDVAKLAKECEIILKETSNPPVILLATQGIIIGELNQGNLKTGKDILIETLKKYPSEFRYFFTTGVNFSAGLVNGVVEWLINQKGDYRTAMDLVKTVNDNIANPEMEKYCDYKFASLADEYDSNLDMVISAYEKAINHNKRWFAINLYKMEIDLQDIISRLDEIKLCQPERAKIITNNVILKPGLKSRSGDFEVFPINTALTILYKDKAITNVDDKYGQWAKVQLENGQVGWIFDNFLQSNVDKSIFSPLRQNEDVWSMAGKDLHRKNVIKANTIYNPTIKAVLPKLKKQVIFSDINNDRILDILAYYPEGLATISGKTQKILWLFECSAGTIPIVDKKSIIISSMEKDGEYINAVAKETGEIIWKIKAGNREHGVVPSSPAIDKNNVYVGTIEQGLLAVNKNNGIISWKFPTGYMVLNDIIIEDDLIFFLSKDKFFGKMQLYAVNTSTGRLVWQFDMKQNDNGSLCFNNGKLFCPSDGNCISAIDSKNGKVLWQTNFTEMIPTSSINSIDRVRRKTNMIQKVNGRKIPVVKQSKVVSRSGDISFKTHLSDDDNTVFAAIENILIAFDISTGKIIWTYKYDKSLWCSPAVVDDAVYIRSIDNMVHAVSKTDGKPLWKYQIDATGNGGDFSPTVAQDLIFIGATNEKMYVLGEE